MARKMTDEEWRALVPYGTRADVPSTVRADGSPHVTPVGVTLRGDDGVSGAAENSAEGSAPARDGRVARRVDGGRPPYGVPLPGGADQDQLLTCSVSSPRRAAARCAPARRTRRG